MTTDAMTVSATSNKRSIPLVVKLLFTAFMAVLVPFYWMTYGPTNFLYFCDVALFLTLVALWREDALLASLAGVGIVLPQLIWVLDFASGFFGAPLLGMTEYMFKDSIPLFARGLSLFHGWLPFLLLWMLHRLGYDKRALVGWTIIAWVLIAICYLFIPGPPALLDDPNIPVNINYVYGLSDVAPQTWMHPHLWVLTLVVGMPLLIFLPTHLVFKRIFREPVR